MLRLFRRIHRAAKRNKFKVIIDYKFIWLNFKRNQTLDNYQYNVVALRPNYGGVGTNATVGVTVDT